MSCKCKQQSLNGPKYVFTWYTCRHAHAGRVHAYDKSRDTRIKSTKSIICPTLGFSYRISICIKCAWLRYMQRVHFYKQFALINRSYGFIYIVQNQLSSNFLVIIQLQKVIRPVSFLVKKRSPCRLKKKKQVFLFRNKS